MGTCWFCALRDRVKYALEWEQNTMLTLSVAVAAFQLSWASTSVDVPSLGAVDRLEEETRWWQPRISGEGGSADTCREHSVSCASWERGVIATRRSLCDRHNQ